MGFDTSDRRRPFDCTVGGLCNDVASDGRIKYWKSIEFYCVRQKTLQLQSNGFVNFEHAANLNCL